MRLLPSASRRGFTLVELLVVLAVISIVAAMLFPVFVAARRASQKAACLTNFRSAHHATLLYVQDYDDRLMPTNHRPGKVPDPLSDQTWPQILQPYAGGFGIFDCPAEPNAMDFGGDFDEDLLPGDYATRYFKAALHSDLGYNAYYLSPTLRQENDWAAQTQAMSALNPRTLLFVESGARDGGSYLVAPPCRYIVDANGWTDTFLPGRPRVNGAEDAVYTPIQGWDVSGSGYQSGMSRGGVGVRHGDRLNVVRVDGSARSVTLAMLSEGCQVGTGWIGAITDPARYPWSPRE